MADKTTKIIAARNALRERFLAKMQREAAEDSALAQGTGAPNRHGLPTLPPGQTETQKWPVLDLGIQPKISTDDWRLQIHGACANPTTLSFADLLAFEQVTESSDFHCVTTWSRMNLQFRGVRLQDILSLVDVHPSASHLMCHGSDEYSTNFSLSEALKTDVLIVHEAEGQPLPIEHGGPVRLITPQLYAWKGAKWICAIELMDQDRPGFWEQNGYSMTGKPWQEDRYSS